MDFVLTHSAEYLLCAVYKLFLSRLDLGQSREKARDMENSTYLHETLMPECALEDVDSFCRELDGVGLFHCLKADDL